MDAEASAGGEGTYDDPLASVQQALSRAEPGETVYLRPGEYREKIESVRGGKPGEPITITGPPDAVLRGNYDDYGVVRIHDSHIHLRGLTIDGLLEPDGSESVLSYVDGQLIQTRPHHWTDEYLTDIVISPHRIGHSRKHLIGLQRTKNAEIGPFKVTGLAGARYNVGDREGHNGEIVYIGTPPPNLGTSWHPWTEADESHNIRVHHIDNSEGFAHSELVNAKFGTHDVLVEYCTDGGGSQNTESYPTASVKFQSYDATVRWCDLRNGKGRGVQIASREGRDRREEKPEEEWSEAEAYGGYQNSVYGNRIQGFQEKALAFPLKNQKAEDQKYICGNDVTGETDGNPSKSCPSSVPEGDGIGHLGGDSPWT